MNATPIPGLCNVRRLRSPDAPYQHSLWRLHQSTVFSSLNRHQSLSPLDPQAEQDDQQQQDEPIPCRHIERIHCKGEGRGRYTVAYKFNKILIARFVSGLDDAEEEASRQGNS